MFWKSFYEDDIQPEIQVPPPPEHCKAKLSQYACDMFVQV